MVVLLCYMVPSDHIVPCVPKSFLTYQAIYKSSHRTITGSPGIVLNDCMIFPNYHIQGPNHHIGPDYHIGLSLSPIIHRMQPSSVVCERVEPDKTYME